MSPLVLSLLLLLLLLLALLPGTVLALAWFARWSQHWGATAREVESMLPGDAWLDPVDRRLVRMTRAISVNATPDTVWPWLAQVGRGAGWYSYDVIDNGRRRSAPHVVSWIPAPAPGDASAIGYLRHVDPGRDLAWWLPGVTVLRTTFRAVMLYRVDAEASGSRIVIRVQADARGPLAWPACMAFRIGDGVMARRQLIGLRRDIERPAGDHLAQRPDESAARDQYQLHHAIHASGEEAGRPGKAAARRWREAAIADGVLADPSGAASCTEQIPFEASSGR